nr:immunoglobulin light chain junction region [Macaca mulatta]MOW60986.1 immunoglobulin light chain junction region [Macaca mulatta]MOW61140.1 immunoglobulin light chain junction region [Macaca mulatta]MOW61327.1 immunoglobulin light chain junction region [Macaca mulatta]
VYFCGAWDTSLSTYIF